MDGSFFVRGFLIGLSIAAVVGPLSILCIQRTLSRGHLYGMLSGLGVGGAEKSYIAAALAICGVFMESAMWWGLLTSSVSLLRQKFTPLWLLCVNRISGALITLFGIVVLLSLKR
jgi:threonine/homoserine/homoserine lactone efflux protein